MRMDELKSLLPESESAGETSPEGYNEAQLLDATCS